MKVSFIINLWEGTMCQDEMNATRRDGADEEAEASLARGGHGGRNYTMCMKLFGNGSLNSLSHHASMRGAAFVMTENGFPFRRSRFR